MDPSQNRILAFYVAYSAFAIRLRHDRYNGCVRRILRPLGLLLAYVLGMSAAIAVLIAVIGSAALGGLAPAVKYWNESPSKLADVHVGQRSVMYDKNGTQFAEIWSENRETVDSLDKVSKYVSSGVVSAEDKNFYHHGAFDLIATIRSAITGSGGGSGITQQLMKNLAYYGSDDSGKAKVTETTIARKVRELKLAMYYERDHSKQDILLKYLNTVAIGSPNVYGVQTAAQTIFGKSAADLTLKESAALAGSVNNPSLYNLMNLADKSTSARVSTRTDYVLGRMLADGVITRAEYREAKAAPLTTDIHVASGGCGASKYPFYCQYVVNYMLGYKLLGSTAKDRAAAFGVGGFAIHTSLDPVKLEKLEKRLKDDYGVHNRVVQATAVVEPGTGGVLAIGANRDWGVDANAGQTQIVLADSPTQVGSTYKMITLAAALNAGWTEQQLMSSVSAACPWTKPGFDYPAGGMQVSTSCALQGGRLSYLQATAYSSNVWFAELESRIGVLTVKKFSGEVGLNTPDAINARSASLTLGVVGDSPIQMAAAYATFANKGVYCPATPITSLSRLDGSSITPPDDYDDSVYSCRSVMSPRSASIVLKAQNANVNGPMPGRFGIDGMISGRSTVGKSGTGDNYANLSWSQTTQQMVVFSDAYDPRGNFQYPLNYVVWRGYGVGPLSEFVVKTTRDYIVNALDGVPNVALDMDNQQTSFLKTRSRNPDLISVPDFTGMSPSSALAALSARGLDGAVLVRGRRVDARAADTGWGDSVVVGQSVAPGTSIMSGSKRVIELSLASR